MKAQIICFFFCGLNDILCLAPSQREMLLQVWIGSKPNHFLAEEELGEVGRFSYLVSFIPSGGNIG